MVMEEHPSPQCVGREFVRQYYTLLNKAPIHLHRFYNNASSFVHGGLDAPDRETAPVVGQKEIHNRIQQLNFRDCHAKISQVDSQATLGNGVVVQVTGELSNGGQPMRRFTQTFVLAAQSPKQYYVHNDIFRYQDFVFSEDDGEWDYSRSTASPPGAAPPAPAAVLPVAQPQPPPQQPPATAALPAPYFPPAASPPSPPPALAAQQQLNGHQDEQTEYHVAGNLSMGLGTSDSSCGDLEPGPEMEEEPIPVHHQPAPVVSTEPKTYANLVKSGPPGSFAQAIQQHHSLSSQGVQAATQRPMVPVPRAVPEPAAPAGSPPGPPLQQRPRAPRTPRTDSASETGGVPAGGNTPPASSGGGRGEGGGGRRYSDSQQLFLGNLPHSATKEEIRNLFEKFGPIAELRVHSKPSGQGARVVPNYAFLTYEEAQSAQNCLNSGPLYYPSEDNQDAQVLNVQEKKSRPGGGPGGPRGGGGGGGGRGGPRPPRPPFQRGGPFPPQRR